MKLLLQLSVWKPFCLREKHFKKIWSIKEALGLHFTQTGTAVAKNQTVVMIHFQRKCKFIFEKMLFFKQWQPWHLCIPKVGWQTKQNPIIKCPYKVLPCTTRAASLPVPWQWFFICCLDDCRGESCLISANSQLKSFSYKHLLTLDKAARISACFSSHIALLT